MVTTRAVLTALHDTLLEQYRRQLAGFGEPRTPKAKAEREALCSGFSDGLRTGMRHTCEMLGVEIAEGK